MIVVQGSSVILSSPDSPELYSYIGRKFVVQEIYHFRHPITVRIGDNHLSIVVPIKALEVLPPETSILKHNQQIKIIKSYKRDLINDYRKDLIGKRGTIRSFDQKNGYFLVKTFDGESGWFPLECLYPLDYKGDIFYYPLQTVSHNGQTFRIDAIKNTKFGNGQLLQLAGEWIPSSDVLPVYPTHQNTNSN